MLCLFAFGGSILSTRNFKRHERERRAELSVSGQVRIVFCILEAVEKQVHLLVL